MVLYSNYNAATMIEMIILFSAFNKHFLKLKLCTQLTGLSLSLSSMNSLYCTHLKEENFDYIQCLTGKVIILNE